MAKQDWAMKKVKNITWTRVLDGSQRCKPYEVAKLLRAERAWAVSIVKRIKPYAYTIDDKALVKRADILAALKG